VTVANAVTGPAVQLATVLESTWADAEAPDIFVENDWLSDGTTSAIPVFDPNNADTYDEIVEAFAAAPTPMSLWIDTGDLTAGGPYATPAGNVTVTSGDYGIDLGGGNVVVLDQGALAGVDEVCGVHSDQFYDVKDIHFDPNRRWVFRYAITGSDSVMPSGINCPRGGQAEIGGNDILNLRGDAVVMMHELGHSLGLRHGGNENTHCKPNYISVMNYAYDAFEGIDTTSGFLLDYSPARLGSGSRTSLMPDIVENNLDERIVLDPTNSEHFVRFSDGAGATRESVANLHLDYSGDGTDPPFEVGQTSVNNQGPSVSSSCDDTGESETLADHDDWSAIRINFRPTGEFGDAVGEVSDETGMVQEGEEDELEANFNRADLEISASTSDPVDGVVTLTAMLRSLDKPDLREPTITFTLSEGLSVVSLADECSQSDLVIECVPTSFVTGPTPSDPVTSSIVVEVAEGAEDASVSVVATSRRNPVSNDPDPTNNTTTLTL